MSRWECIVCGWVYDEAKGWPDDGIAAGTKWADVPEGWLCPDCGVGKEDFELIAEEPVPDAPHHEAVEHTTLVRPVVIIGTGLAGYNLAKEFRKLDKDSPLLIITADDGANYSKPMLSTGYTRNTDARALMMESAGSMARQLNASVWTFTRVTDIDTAQQQIKVGDAITVAYSKLVIAWGADTIKPPIEGDGLDLVYSINDLLDYDDFRVAVEKNKAKKVAIIGGGLIGCEFTNDLLNGGFDIDVVDPLGYCLPTLLPEAAGKAVQRALEEKGARFHFGPLVTHVNRREEGGVRVTLNNGQTIDADIVVSAVGVRARTELAKKAGINCNRGIVANRFCETSAPNVYTLGDCAEIEGHVLYYVLPLMACARALAKTLTGSRTPVVYPAMPVSIKTPACPVVVAPPPRDATGEWGITADGNNVTAEFRSPEGSLLGFALTGTATSEKVRLQKELPPVLP
jgi:rubredoxin-NAD+ reductase